MTMRRRWAAMCGALTMTVTMTISAACSSSPTEPTRLPLAVEVVTGQTLTVPGTDLELTLEPLARCPPDASCLAGPRVRLSARAGGRAPVDVFIAFPVEGRPQPQPVHGYTVAVRFFNEERTGVVRVFLTVDRS